MKTHLKEKVVQLRRLELAHMLKGIRTRNNPYKVHYHVVMAEDCRLRIEYINKEISK